MYVRITLKGVSPLLMHNPRMVDPEFEINRALKALTGKRKKTDEDLKQIGRLEWFGGIYTMTTADGVPVVSQPSSKVRKCLVETGRISKQGKQVERALSFLDLDVPLIYDGPRDLEEIFQDSQFISRLSVGVMGKRVMRVRPQFFPWALDMKGLFIEDAGLNFEDLERIVELAGAVGGIGDNRVNGYGRFIGKVFAQK
jgi:hypothetical protein